MAQKLIYYNHNVCFTKKKQSTLDWTDLDNFYHPYFYKNNELYSISPDDDIIIVLLNCGNHWFGHGLLNKFTFSDENKFQIQTFDAMDLSRVCIWIKNVAPYHPMIGQAPTLHIPAGTPLSKLLNHKDIVYKLGYITLKELTKTNRVAMLNPGPAALTAEQMLPTPSPIREYSVCSAAPPTAPTTYTSAEEAEDDIYVDADDEHEEDEDENCIGYSEFEELKNFVKEQKNSVDKFSSKVFQTVETIDAIDAIDPKLLTKL